MKNSVLKKMNEHLIGTKFVGFKSESSWYVPSMDQHVGQEGIITDTYYTSIKTKFESKCGRFHSCWWYEMSECKELNPKKESEEFLSEELFNLIKKVIS